MASIPTASRIFADRYCREARRLEALHAGLLAPGTKTWGAALAALFRCGSAGGPVRQAALLRQAIARLNAIPPAEAVHIALVGGSRGKRTAALMLMTFGAGRHPLGLDEDGLRVLLHALTCARGGAGLHADILLTYISRHAMGRLHERGHRLAAGAARSVFGYLGILGLITRHSDKHVRGGLSLRDNDILAVGSIKQAAQRCAGDGQLYDGSFLDIRTVLWTGDVKNRGPARTGANCQRGGHRLARHPEPRRRRRAGRAHPVPGAARGRLHAAGDRGCSGGPGRLGVIARLLARLNAF
jgi:hypothetical protein